MSRGPAWKRSSDEARAEGGSLSKIKSDKAIEQLTDEELNITIKKDDLCSHLRLASSRSDESSKHAEVSEEHNNGKSTVTNVDTTPSDLIVLTEASTVNSATTQQIDISAATSQQKHCAGLGTIDTHKQKKKLSQNKNRQRKHRRVALASGGEVKQMEKGSFPSAADLPVNGLLFDNL